MKTKTFGKDIWQALYNLQATPQESRTELTKETKKALIDAGMIDKSLKFTKAGKTAAAMIFNRMKTLRAGIPLKERSIKPDPQKLFSNGGGWTRGDVSMGKEKGKLRFTSNGTIAFRGKPPRLIKPKKMLKKRRKALKFLLEALGKTKGWIRVKGFAMQANNTVGSSWVWLRDAKKIKRAAIPTADYDFIKDRWPKGKIYFRAGVAPWSKKEMYPIIVKSDDEIVCLVATLDPAGLPLLDSEKKK